MRASLVVVLTAAATCRSFVDASPGYRALVNTPSDLPFDENGKLATHMLLYPPGPCVELMKKGLGTPEGFEFRALSGVALTSFLPDHDSRQMTPPTRVEDCPAVCLEQGVDQTLVTKPMPNRFFTTPATTTMDDWFYDNCMKLEVGFMNYLSPDQPLKMYWVKSDGTRHYRNDLYYGEKKTLCTESYIGHIFEFDLNDETVFRFRAAFTSMISIGPNPEYGPLTYNTTARVREIMDGEIDKQDKIKRTFTAIGFKKGRLPDDVFGSMGAFYYNNRNHGIREEWQTQSGVYINWWETDVDFIPAPWQLKKAWQTRLLDLVQAWAGVPLEQTDMYGMRRYNEHARLLTHVDREETHAASLIVNVAQGGVTEPWPVEVYDHANRLHQVTMEPGDIVYYESATCLHGRNTPMRGAGSYYVNIFTHYRPVGDPQWYTKPNPEGAPEPLMDVGECRLEGAPEIGVGAVKCDNPNIGPYLSPSLSSVKTGQDLFDWWLKVGRPTDGASREEL